MDFKLTEEQKALKKEYDDFFEQEMKNAPPGFGTRGEDERPDDRKFTRYMTKKIAEKGWNIMAWPKEYGGRDAPIIEQMLFAEAQGYQRAPGIEGFGVRMFGPTLILYASEEQKKRLIPPIAKAEVVYCQGWSEPNAGSDLASLTTQAIKKGDHYIVNGQKTWTTMAHHADHMFLLARTDPESRRSKGLSVFNVDLSLPGIEIRPIQYMNKAHIVNEVFFSDVKIPEEERIGPEGEGWKLTRATMNFERSNIGAYATVKRTLEDLIEYCKITKRGGKYLTEYPGVRAKLATLYTDMEVGRSLAYRIAWLQQEGTLAFSPSVASESKVFATELAQRVSWLATKIMGLYGGVEASKWAPMNGRMVSAYQHTIGSTICAGSNEIQRNIIAWVGLELPRFK